MEKNELRRIRTFRETDDNWNKFREIAKQKHGGHSKALRILLMMYNRSEGKIIK